MSDREGLILGKSTPSVSLDQCTLSSKLLTAGPGAVYYNLLGYFPGSPSDDQKSMGALENEVYQ